MTQVTDEQKAAAAAAKAAEKQAKVDAAAAAKQAKADAAAAAKAAKQAEKDAKVAAKQAEKDAAAAQKVADAEAKKAEKEKAIADAKAAKDANRQPEQNGVRRPGPNGLCGRVWGLADNLSASLGQPVPIADLLVAGEAEGLNTANIRTEYARWKKFNGIQGRVTKPEAATA